MRLRPTGIAPYLIAALSGCTAESSDDRPEREPAIAVAAESGAAVARTDRDELGELVPELGDHLWVVFQDKKGTYWLGSDGEGVYRYDGQTTRRYTTRDGLCNDHIRQILEDESGNLYFNTCGGISRFDGRIFSMLTPIRSAAADGGWKLQPRDLWFTGGQDDNGPLRYDGESLYRLEFPPHELDAKWRSLFPNVPYSPYATYTVRKDSQGSVWFGTATLGPCRFDGASFTWVAEDELTEFHNGPSFGIRGIAEDKDGKFWFSNTLHRYDVPPAGSTANARGAAKYGVERGIDPGGTQTGAYDAYFVSGLKGRDDALWLATYGAGVWRYDGEHLTHYPVAEGNQPVLLYSIHEDNAGVLWLGTTESGVYRFNGTKFERFRPGRSPEQTGAAT